MKCDHCGYIWEPRKDNPKFCPACKRPLFNFSSRKVVQPHKPVDPTPFVLCNAPECTNIALFDVPKMGKLCRDHYIEFLHSVRQPTQEELMSKEA